MSPMTTLKSSSCPPSSRLLQMGRQIVRYFLITIILLSACFTYTILRNNLQHATIVISALLHVSIYPVVITGCVLGLYLSRQIHCDNIAGVVCCSNDGHNVRVEDDVETVNKGHGATKKTGYYWPRKKGVTYFILLPLAMTWMIVIDSILQTSCPSWLWNPFSWGRYKTWETSELREALKDLNLDDTRGGDGIIPLGLTASGWETLSAGGISPHNTTDVSSIISGINYARHQSNGLIINVMSRDTIDAIQPLRDNVESFLPFFSNVAVVIFENDSVDGTRDAIKRWADEAEGYVVDLLDCDDAPDCIFGETHRYDDNRLQSDYWQSSSIGRMAEFRQRLLQHILTNKRYSSYSHMIVYDMDLAIPLSPLGVMHSLGVMPEHIVVSSGRQIWPGSLGTLIPPYDFTAYVFYPSPRNDWAMTLHDTFCGLRPKGHRWRNMCHAPSAAQLAMILVHDAGTEPYKVMSAYNGAVMYPLSVIRQNRGQAKYDAGEDGQRCEHVGFHLSLKRPVYVNPKWTFHVKPDRPGGPTGRRASRQTVYIVQNLHISLLILFQNVGLMVPIVYLTAMIVIHILFPLWLKLYTGVKLYKYYYHKKAVGQTIMTTSEEDEEEKFAREKRENDIESVTMKIVYSDNAGNGTTHGNIWGRKRKTDRH